MPSTDGSATRKADIMWKSMAAAALAIGIPAADAAAQSCADRETLVAQLGQNYQERLAAAGLYDPTHLVELFVSEDGGTWTLLLSRADGVTCVMSSGQAWSDYPDAGFAGVEGVEG
jgi:hypothetical protein